MAESDVIAELADLARELSVEIRTEDDRKLSLYWPGFATVIVEETGTGTLMLAIWVRTTSYDWPGERTDLNELFALLISLSLHQHGVSAWHANVEHPGADIPGELYATYLIPRQPYPGGIPSTRAGIDFIRQVVLDMLFIVPMAATLLESCGWDRRDEGEVSHSVDGSQRGWVDRVARALEAEEDNVTFTVRKAPTWRFLRTADGHAVFNSEPLCSALIAWLGGDQTRRFEGPTGVVLKNNGLLNYVSTADRDKCVELFRSSDDPRTGRELLLAVENRIVAVSEANVVVRTANASRSAALDERARISERHASEHELLFDSAAIRWASRIEPARFEQLVKALLEHEPGVQRVRIAGAATEQDGGRDLLVEWETPLLPSEVDANSPSQIYRVRRVVVQCKADAAPVGIGRVIGVGDTLDQYQADGYLLVVRSRLTRPLVDRLDQRRAAGKVWVEWWTGDELDRRLLENRHLAVAFSDLLALVHENPHDDDVSR